MLRFKGIVMIVIGSMLWGATGPMMEWLLAHTAMTSAFMLSVRLIIAGVIILCIMKYKGQPIFSIWHNKIWYRKMLLFSVIGMMGLQYSFVLTIEVSNAVVATLLQFLAPIFIITYVSLRHKKWPSIKVVIGILGTLFGLFFLLTNGSISSLMVSEKALFYGVILGVTYAFYTLYPVQLMKEFGVLSVVSWAMILSGVYSAIIGRIWATDEWQLFLNPQIAWMMIALIILGTVAYILFLYSMHYISAVETSILSSFEPITAMIISVIWLNAILLNGQIFGIFCMICFIAYLSIIGKEKA